MRIVGVCKSGSDVKTALEKAGEEINKKLTGIGGNIEKMRVSIEAGVGGAVIEIALSVSGDNYAKKKVVFVNERGISEEQALKNAERKINNILKDLNGSIADFFVKTTTTPIPGRVYSTIIVAINENSQTEIPVDKGSRREILRNAISLLGGDPKALNISKVAEIFTVSRDIIYKDLEELGYKRG
ncbi:MAG: hypothetical protein ACE5K4_02520 [Candidatus Hydrothermarchaeota archaeon]